MTEPMPGAPWFPAGLDPAVAQAISDEWWDADPHWAAYLAWTYYAATLPPAPSVASVGTGSQTVMYAPASAPGELGAALQRAEWHREQSAGGGLASVPLMANTGLREALSASNPLWWETYPLPAQPPPPAPPWPMPPDALVVIW